MWNPNGNGSITEGFFAPDKQHPCACMVKLKLYNTEKETHMNEQKSAFIAIVGRANVGKSSLLNAMMGQKVAIVSPKPQTTRTRILGIHTAEETQLIFVDTPGLHLPRNRLGESMVRAVQEGLSDVEACVMVIDSADVRKNGDTIVIHKAEQALIDQLAKRKIPAVLAVNKVDLVPNKTDLLAIIDTYMRAYAFDEVFPLSARSGKGVPALLTRMMDYAVEAPHYFDDDALTDQTERVMAAETIREKLLFVLDREVPHGVAVSVDAYHSRGKVLDIEATIFCERDSHKGMIIGKSGEQLKVVGTRAREDIEQRAGQKVNLQLWVKVKPNWRNKESAIRSFGLEQK